MNYSNWPNSSTKLCCLIGNPVEQSPSPTMHNAAFRHLGVNAVYLAFSIENQNLSEAISGLKAVEFLGANITMPHKERTIPLLDEIDPMARKVGAVNTILNNGSKLIGFNTDVEGFANPLEKKAKIAKLTAMIIGAGGASKACAYSLAINGCRKITILNRTLLKAKKLVTAIEKEFDVEVRAEQLNEKSTQNQIGKHNLVVNATPLGMHEEWFGLSLEGTKLPEGTIAYDLVYRPVNTYFLNEFRRQGAVCISGYEMLVEQAALSFEIWTRRKAPKKIMTKVALSSIRGSR